MNNTLVVFIRFSKYRENLALEIAIQTDGALKRINS